jgi:hypothetical protein
VFVSILIIIMLINLLSDQHIFSPRHLILDKELPDFLSCAKVSLVTDKSGFAALQLNASGLNVLISVSSDI